MMNERIKRVLIGSILATHLVVLVNNGVSAEENEALELQCSQVDAVALNALQRLVELFAEVERLEVAYSKSEQEFDRIQDKFMWYLLLGNLPRTSETKYELWGAAVEYASGEGELARVRTVIEQTYSSVGANLTLLRSMLSVRETYCSEVTDGPTVSPSKCRWGDPERRRVASSKAIHTMDGVSLERCKIACEVRRPDCQSILYHSGRCRVYDTIGRFDPGSETNFEHYTCDLPPT